MFRTPVFGNETYLYPPQEDACDFFKTFVRHLVSIVVNTAVYFVNGTPISRHSFKCTRRGTEGSQQLFRVHTNAAYEHAVTLLYLWAINKVLALNNFISTDAVQ